MISIRFKANEFNQGIGVVLTDLDLNIVHLILDVLELLIGDEGLIEVGVLKVASSRHIGDCCELLQV